MSDDEPTPGSGPTDGTGGGDDEPTLAEQAEAAALAAALQGEPVPAGPLPLAAEEALQAAALLRFSQQAELSPARAEAVLQSVLAARPLPAPAPGRGWAPRWRWLAPLGGLAAGATAAALLLLAGPPAPPTGPTALPVPDVRLLAAQARQLGTGGGPAGEAGLEQEMHRYRQQVYAALARRYAGER